MPLNLYTPVDTLRGLIPTAAASDDADIEIFVEEASRAVDGDTHRFFYTENVSRIIDGTDGVTLLLDNDLLSVSELVTDSELDGTFDGETWVSGDVNDFVLRPDNSWPKTEVYVNPWGDFGFENQPRYVKITGTWGFGDGVSADPWYATGLTGTLSSASDATIEVSAAGLFYGQTLLIEDEQVYLKATPTGAPLTAAVDRGVNGTTGIGHTAKAISTAIYPPGIIRAATWLATMYFQQREGEVYESERIGDYQYKRPIALNARRIWDRMIGNFVNKVTQ